MSLIVLIGPLLGEVSIVCGSHRLVQPAELRRAMDLEDRTREERLALEDLLAAARRAANRLDAASPWGRATRILAHELGDSFPQQPLRLLGGATARVK